MAGRGDRPAAGRERLLADAIGFFAAHGAADVSLRALAAEIGTSHRMLIYHFGSRDGLLTAVVERVEADQRVLLDQILATGDGPVRIQLQRFWTQVSDAALVYGPLFFELSGHAMRGRPHAESLRTSLIGPWLDSLEHVYRRAGYSRRRARTHARLGLAVARGLLFDLLVTGDRAEIDASMRAFIRASMPSDA